MLHILGSSSRGNGYLLQSSTGEVLCLEAGVPLARVKKTLGFDIKQIGCCLITHEHGDHAKYAEEYADAFIPLMMSKGTADALEVNHTWTPFPKEIIQIGEFRVMPFPTKHDAADPYGYLIHHKECGTVLFATDTYYLPNKFSGLSNILIECNYRLDILDKNIRDGLVHPKVRDRIVKSHMSYQTCCETLQANDLSKVNNIILIHLSSDNSHADEFRNGIAALTEKNVIVAKGGMTIDFNQTPY